MMSVSMVCCLILAGEPDAVTLEDALRLAEQSPWVAAVEADIEVARAEEHQARLLPNPQIEYQGYARTFGTSAAINGQQHQVDVGIPLLLAGQRRFRMRAAALQTAAVQAEVCVARKEVAREVALRWVELLAAQEGHEALVTARAALEETEALTRARAARGAQTEYDVQRVDHELAVLDSTILAAHAEVEDASRALASVLGRPQWVPRADGDLGEPIAVAGASPELESLPVVAALRRAEQAAEGREALARRGRWPVPVLSAGSYVTTDGDSASVTFGLQVPLPLFDRGQAEVARARAEVRRAQLRTQAVQRTASAELERARALLAERQAAVDGFRPQVEEAAPRLRAMAQRAYAGGVSSVLELIDAERTYLEARLRALELARARARAAVDLEAARGGLGVCG